MFYHKDGNGEKMKNAKKMGGFSITFLLILGTLSLSITISPKTWGEESNILYVDDNGTADYSSITAAIDNASIDDTIYLYSGIYYENIIVDKTVNLIGDDIANTIIDGGGSGDVVNISAENVEIHNITIRNSGLELSNVGVKIKANNATISNCNIYNCTYGTYITNSTTITVINCTYHQISTTGAGIYFSSNIKIIDCVLNNTGTYGIGIIGSDNISINNCLIYTHLYCGIHINESLYVTVDSCDISRNNDEYGIYVDSSYFTTSSKCNLSNSRKGIYLLYAYKCVISNNVFYYNQENAICAVNSGFNEIKNCIVSHCVREGLDFNISANNVIEKCTIKNNWQGLRLCQSTNNTVSMCKFTNKNKNIVIDTAGNNLIETCEISEGTKGIYIIKSADGNHIYHNNFIENIQNAFDECNNSWDNDYPSGGNYWSDFDEPSEGAYDNYSGLNQTTSGGDGIVDGESLNPYAISGGNNQDRYPLINPFELDFTPPYTKCNCTSMMGAKGWAISNVSVELTAVDNDSSVNTTMYCINNDDWVEYTEPFTIITDGIHSLKFYSIDIFDNDENVRMKEIKIDKEDPVLSYYLQPSEPNGKDEWYLRNVEVTISVNDTTSGVSSIAYNLGGDTWNAYTGYFLITTEGSHNFSILARDNADNIAYKNTTIKIDKTAPVVSIHSLPTYVKGITQIQWNANDSVDNELNGNISLYLTQENNSFEVAVDIDNTGIYEWDTSLFPDFSLCYIEVVAQDDAGNIGNKTSNAFVLDNTPPTVDIRQPKKGDVLGGDMLSIFWDASDNIDTNLDTICIEYSNNSGKTWNEIAENIQNTATGYAHGISTWKNGDYMIKVNATDDTGNEGETISGNFTIDREGPIVKIDTPENGYLYVNLLEREILPPIPIQFILAFTEPLTNISTIIVGKTTVEISATDEYSEINNIIIFEDGEEKIRLFEAPYTYEWNCPLGKHDLKVVAYDKAGNQNEDTVVLKNILCINA
jgi:parallel beta-helix repeat protein